MPTLNKVYYDLSNLSIKLECKIKIKGGIFTKYITYGISPPSTPSISFNFLIS